MTYSFALVSPALFYFSIPVSMEIKSKPAFSVLVVLILIQKGPLQKHWVSRSSFSRTDNTLEKVPLVRLSQLTLTHWVRLVPKHHV